MNSESFLKLDFNALHFTDSDIVNENRCGDTIEISVRNIGIYIGEKMYYIKKCNLIFCDISFLEKKVTKYLGSGNFGSNETVLRIGSIEDSSIRGEYYIEGNNIDNGDWVEWNIISKKSKLEFSDSAEFSESPWIFPRSTDTDLHNF